MRCDTVREASKTETKCFTGLSLTWTAAKTRDISFSEISKLLSSQPARMCGLDDRKGNLSEGMDADFVIWDPEETIKVSSIVRIIFQENSLRGHIIKKICFIFLDRDK